MCGLFSSNFVNWINLCNQVLCGHWGNRNKWIVNIYKIDKQPPLISLLGQLDLLHVMCLLMPHINTYITRLIGSIWTFTFSQHLKKIAKLFWLPLYDDDCDVLGRLRPIRLSRRTHRDRARNR